MKNRMCDICGNQMAMETHHLIFGRGIRSLCDTDNQTLELCQDCHKEVHSRGTSAMLSKMLGQALWEMNAINDGENMYKVRDKFRERYGRSWL